MAILPKKLLHSTPGLTIGGRGRAVVQLRRAAPRGAAAAAVPPDAHHRRHAPAHPRQPARDPHVRRLGGRQGRGASQNKHSTDIDSTKHHIRQAWRPPVVRARVNAHTLVWGSLGVLVLHHKASPRVCMSIHPDGKSCGRVRSRFECLFCMTLLRGPEVLPLHRRQDRAIRR